MRILLIGSGAREQAMARAILTSPMCDDLFVAPGNGGIEMMLMDKNAANIIAIKPNDITGLVDFAVKKKIDFVISGPEEPLTLGLYDAMMAKGVNCLGPSYQAAKLEGSKLIMKKLAMDNAIPTARYEYFSQPDAAKTFAKKLWHETQKPIVIKTDGLAAGKGVIIADTLPQAIETIDDMLVAKKFGLAGQTIIIEEFLYGREISYFVLSDGEHGVFMGSAEDHKQAFDNDKGPNTGGMGAFAPSPILTPDLQATIEKKIVIPTIKGMKKMAEPYSGILFFGLMVDGGEAKLLEINIRLGDPEAAVILATMQTDFLTALLSAHKKSLDDFSIKHWKKENGEPQMALAVVMASRGYPDKPVLGQEIILPTDLPPDCYVFHASTQYNQQKKLIANGGRVLTVMAIGDTIAMVRHKVYGVIDKIIFPDSFYRRDIGERDKKHGY
ncbi:MAG: phosphoribosylamine--glycine ligase [Alphaproteobacteria bacterium]